MASTKKRETKPAEAPRPERLDLMHGRYRIVAGWRKGAYHAIAYLGPRRVEASSGDSVEAAIESLKAVLDARAERLRAERVDGVPTEAEFGEALATLDGELPASILALLRLHGRLRQATGTLAELADFGDRSQVTIAAGYARLGRRVGSLLDFAPEPDGLDAKLAPLQTFARVEQPSGKHAKDRGALVLRLRPEVVAALAALDRPRDDWRD